MPWEILPYKSYDKEIHIYDHKFITVDYDDVDQEEMEHIARMISFLPDIIEELKALCTYIENECQLTDETNRARQILDNIS